MMKFKRIQHIPSLRYIEETFRLCVRNVYLLHQPLHICKSVIVVLLEDIELGWLLAYKGKFEVFEFFCHLCWSLPISAQDQPAVIMATQDNHRQCCRCRLDGRDINVVFIVGFGFSFSFSFGFLEHEVVSMAIALPFDVLVELIGRIADINT